MNTNETADRTINQLADNHQLTPENQAIRRETRQLVERAIDQLPEKYRVVHVLREVEGMPHAEIAVSLGLSDSNVKVRLHRARNLLRENIYKLSSDTSVFEFGNVRCDRVVENVMSGI